jgi:hypothetical protein
MKAKQTVRVLVLLAAVIVVCSHPFAGDPPIAPGMAGRWEGDARIVVSWCKQSRLHCAVEIAPDGTVTGKVGDATLVNARLMRNRGWVGRKLDLATDYIIKGDLKGDMVAAESIRRSGVSMPLDCTATGYSGGVHSTGSKFGGKAEGILSASSLNLTRSK